MEQKIIIYTVSEVDIFQNIICFESIDIVFTPVEFNLLINHLNLFNDIFTLPQVAKENHLSFSYKIINFSYSELKLIDKSNLDIISKSIPKNIFYIKEILDLLKKFKNAYDLINTNFL